MCVALFQDTHKSHTGYAQFAIVVSVLLAFIPLLFRLYNTSVSIIIFSAFGSGYLKSRFLESILFFSRRIRILLPLHNGYLKDRRNGRFGEMAVNYGEVGV